jgi:general secretion pathway protein D
MYKYLLVILMVLASVSLALAATTNTNAPSNPNEETVTFLESTNYNDALQILELYSWKYERKKIINLSNQNDAIGIPIHNLTWRKALELITLKKGLLIEETVGAIITKGFGAATTGGGGEAQTSSTQSEINTKQVRISAVAFIADKAYLRSLGIDWSTILNGSVQADINFNTAGLVPTPVMGIGASRATTWGNNTIEVNTLLNVIESNQLGSIIARPNIMVSSGKAGFIQVGQDISVKTVDEAGNTTDQFFATGVILNVEPTILVSMDSVEVVNLKVKVERSAAIPGAVSTIINKSLSSTDLILYNGEETVIGGLYDTDETKLRSGIPILRDLPWWVFGIRYLTGYYKIEKKERELVIILKAEIIDDAITRLKHRKH